MVLDVVEVHGVAEPRRLEQVPHVGPQDAVLGDLVAVGLEVPVVDRVEAHERREEPHVGLGDVVTHQVAALRQPVRQPVEPFEEDPERRVVLLLRVREPGPVDPVVDVEEDLLGDVVDLVAPRLGVQVGRAGAVVGGPLGRQVERDLRVVVRDEQPGRDVDDRRHAHPAVVLGVAREVVLGEEA
ncbi:hypothetical protein D3C74_377120 [compost metagenome]